VTYYHNVVIAGEGGFGHVVLCVNKLDGRRYAMKKIRLKVNTLSQNNKILRFVHFQSNLFRLVLEDLGGPKKHFRLFFTCHIALSDFKVLLDYWMTIVEQ